MIIVSQDKMRITESLELTIEANTIEKGSFPTTTIKIIGYYILDRKNGIVLGDYATKERAKEVLQEIIDLYKQSNYVCKIANIEYQEINHIFEMPED